MNRILRYACLVITVFVSQAVFGNVISDTIFINTDGYDAFVHSGSSGSNYATDANLYVHRNGIGANTVQRTYLKADLSSIPTYAILTSARLRMYAETVDNTGNHDMLVSRVTSSWTEGGVTWTSFPSITNSGATTIPHDTTKNTGWQNLRITSLVQYAVNYPAQNLGWLIQLSSEGSSTTRGVKYSSSENGTAGRRCYLVVDYVLPIEVEGVVSHCTAGANDGAITVSMSGGDGTWGSYEWFQYSSGTVTSIESGTNMANKDISGLADGLYLFRVRDGGTTAGYKYFMVGEYGATTSVEFRNASSTSNSQLYNEDANLVYDVGTGKGQATGGGGSSDMYAYKSSSLYYSSLLKYQVDFDSVFTINSASLRLISSGHYRNASPATTDSGYVSRVTANWYESYVTWDTKPATTTTNRITINQTSPAGAVTRNDTLDVKNFVLYWQDNPDQNYGIDLSLKKYAQASDAYLRYYSSDHTTAANRPGFVVSYSLPQQIVTTYVDSIDAGHITITAPSGELPYTYLLSRDTLPRMTDLWNAIKDSTAIDSTYLFQGKSNTQTFRFSNLPSDRYYVGVYDNNGDQILMKEVILTPTFERSYVSGDFEMVNGSFQVKAGNTDAEATLKARLPADENGGIEFQVMQLTNIVRYGFTDVDDSRPSALEDYKYAVEIKTTGKVYLSRSDTLVDSTTVIVGDRLILTREDGTVYLYKNNVAVGADAVPAGYNNDWKVDIELKGSSGKIKPLVYYGKLKLPKLKFSVDYPKCGETEAHVSLSVPASTYFGITSVTYYLRDQDDNLIASGSSLPPSMTLDIGIYTLYYTYSVTTLSGTVSYSQYYDQIAVGYPVQWTWDPSTDNITQVPGYLNTIKPTVSTTTAKANAENECKDDPSVLNWLQFESSGKSQLIFTAGSWNWAYEEIQLRADGSLYARVRVEELGGGLVSRQVLLYNAGSYDSGYLTSSLKPFSVEFPTDGGGDYDKVELYQEGVMKGDFNTTGVDGIMTVNAKELGKVLIQNAIVSFCGENKAQHYADVTHKLDGGFYLARKGLVRFIYQEEYKDLNGNLTYNVYDATNQVVISNAMIPLPAAYGDNRYELDFSCSGAYTLSDGIYVLEVINEKNEKWYLRFKVVDNC